MTVKGIVGAYGAEIKTLSFEDLKELLNPEWIGLNGSPTRVVKSFTKEAKGKGTKLTGLSADEAVAAIVEKLDELHII
jgi:electron transfer flavoprotein beta subunit